MIFHLIKYLRSKALTNFSLITGHHHHNYNLSSIITIIYIQLCLCLSQIVQTDDNNNKKKKVFVEINIVDEIKTEIMSIDVNNV